jgi:putative transposase
VDDQRVVSGILHVIRNGLRWRDAPAEYGPHKTLYNRFIRWSRMGCSTASSPGSRDGKGEPDRLMIDATHSRRIAQRPACSKRGCSRRIGRTKAA